MIHASAARGYPVAAHVYDLGRPGYPAAAVEWLTERLGITSRSLVMDLGAGTGKFTRLLCELGSHTVAVEPIETMARKLLGIHPAPNIVAGIAEAIPLRDESMDAAIVAHAFHWFCGDEAVRELHRVLRPGGGLGLVWNSRDMSDPLQAELNRILSPYRDFHGIRASHTIGRWQAAFERSHFFTALEKHSVPNTQEMHAQNLIHLVQSISYIAALPSDVRRRVLSEVHEVARRLPTTFLLHYSTDCYVCYRVSSGTSSTALCRN
jgi:SAM-dependent methyltransferase